MPQCAPAQLAVSASAGAQTSALLTVEAKAATPGSYLLIVTGTDPTIGLTRMTTLPYTVNITPFTTTPLTLSSGAASDITVNFTLPTGAIDLNCDFAIISPSVTPVPTSTIPIGCTPNPGSIGSTTSASLQSIPVTVTVNTGGAMTQLSTQSNTVLAGLLGIPVLALLGLVFRGNAQPEHSSDSWMQFLFWD